MRTLFLALTAFLALALLAPTAASQDAASLRRANAAAKAEKQTAHQARLQARRAQYEMWRRSQAAKHAQASKARQSSTRATLRTSLSGLAPARPTLPTLRTSQSPERRPILRSSSASRGSKHDAATHAKRGVSRKVPAPKGTSRRR